MRLARRALLGIAAIGLVQATFGPLARAGDAQTFVSPIPKPRPAVPSSFSSPDIPTVTRSHSGVAGWLVVDMDTGAVLDSHDPDRPFAPASVAKLPTAAFALDALGPDYRFETQVLATGSVSGDQLDGDLILSGGGNPELDTDSLAPLARQIAEQGIRTVTGQLIADGSALPQLSMIEVSQGDSSTYNPSISGLNLNFNRVHVKWDARKGRNHLSVEAQATRLSPPVTSVRVAVGDVPGSAVFTFLDNADHEQWRMASRAMRGRAARWLPVKHPERYAAEVFAVLAGEHGVQMGLPRTGRTPGDARVLASHSSRPLTPILRDMLRYSNNLTAEVTGTTATRSVGVEVSTLAESADVMNAWAASVAGFPLGDPGFQFKNHSGLTTASKVSPRRMVDLLLALGRRDAPSDRSHTRLPGSVAGILKSYNVAAKNVALDYDNLAIVAKTGTMSYIRGLAGYVATPGGRRLAFAIFSNDLVARGGGGAQPVHRGWMRRAKGFERALIRNWVLQADG
ncbi:MAG: D-alanyl-D-alanine carboxypeptidase/D-alanyl-D-alanine-endopeptidase [Pseudomonadota bacterium]